MVNGLRGKESRLARCAVITGLLLIAPPLVWLLIIWADQVPSSWSHPIFAYGLVAIAMSPGLAGIWMLRLRSSTKMLLAPLYAASMGFALLALGLLFVCVATHDCP